MKLQRKPFPQFGMALFVPALTVGALLVFFVLLGGTFLLQPGIVVDVPRSPFLLAPQRNPKVVAVTAAPIPGIFLDNLQVTGDGLDEALEKFRGESRTIIIKADRLAPVDLVVQVFNTATQRGFSVVLATSETK